MRSDIAVGRADLGPNREPSAATGAVLPTPGATVRLRPVDAAGVRIRGGFFGERLRINRTRTLPHGAEQLERAGNFGNFAVAAGAQGTYHAGVDESGLTLPFLDSDVYKWLEAVGWELGRQPDGGLHDLADRVIELIRAAQRQDGYLNTYVQVLAPGEAYRDLPWRHELYSTGHLIQAAIAWWRAVGDDRLLAVARRAADSIDAELGPTGRAGIDGHPQIEMALVELYRVTNESKYLELAQQQIAQRGHGLLGSGRFGASYWQDHEPVASATVVTGHAVRQMYLDCGAVDVATETGDAQLLAAVIERWNEMLATRTYLTGAIGSRHRDESFGDPFELPPEEAYAETCAAIGEVMLAWRLLLATGDPRFADHFERTLYNAVLPGVSLDGSRFFYTNPLQRRADREATTIGPAAGDRASWFACACCPPNIMRTLASLEHYLVTADATGVQVHQYATSSLRIPVEDGHFGLAVDTNYPSSGTVAVRITSSPQRPWTLALRVPAWSSGATLTINDAERSVGGGDRMVRETRAWQAGDRVELRLPMPPRLTSPDRRIDAVRGCLAIERGPLVYCVEGADLPGGVALDDLVFRRDPLELAAAPASLPEVPSIRAWASAEPQPNRRPWPYQDVRIPRGLQARETISVLAVPYFAWANRRPGGMKVWLPFGDPSDGTASASGLTARPAPP